MHKFFLILLLTLLSASFSNAQTLADHPFTLPVEAEVMLDLNASAANTSWRVAGREAAAVRVLLDGQYQQDVILFGGAQQHTYALSLGRVAAGTHRVSIELNREQNAPQAGAVTIHDLSVMPLTPAMPGFQLLAHAPVLYARPNTIGKFSDVPLLMYGETEKRNGNTLLRYTVIFSNEDGGTQTSALMARWGRATDIEYVCETEIDAQGKAIKTTFQGLNHVDTEFTGQRLADHPLFLTASNNNNFVQQGTSPMRFALRPLPVELSKASRESVMDAHPWTYRVMADEMERESKLTSERTLGLKIAPFQQYLFIDADSTQRNGALLSFAVKLKGDAKWHTSDLGIGYYKIDRSGFFRTTIRLPQAIKLDQIERIAARCDLPGNPRSGDEITKATSAACELRSVNKVLILDGKLKLQTAQECWHGVTLAFGETAELVSGCASKR